MIIDHKFAVKWLRQPRANSRQGPDVAMQSESSEMDRGTNLGDTSLDRMLGEIEATACTVYARHGLPDRLGSYARSPKTGTWRFLSESMTAEERWALVLAQKDSSAWRFGLLHDVGDDGANPLELRGAAQVLRLCHQMRSDLGSLGRLGLSETLEAAINLGAAWRDLRGDSPLHSRRTEPLKLTLPPPAGRSRNAQAKRVAKAKAV